MNITNEVIGNFKIFSAITHKLNRYDMGSRSMCLVGTTFLQGSVRGVKRRDKQEKGDMRLTMYTLRINMFSNISDIKKHISKHKSNVKAEPSRGPETGLFMV